MSTQGFLTRLAILFLVLPLLAGTLRAQKSATTGSWQTKPVSEWDTDDVKSILQDSAWGKAYLEKSSFSKPATGTAIYDTSIVFTLRSALIVRLAIVRAEQIKAKYDSMDAKAKAELTKRLKPILDCELCQKYYIVSVRGDSELLRQAPRVQNRASHIYLSNEKGEKRQLSSFTPQKGSDSEALFYFNRYDASGKPLITADNQILTFYFRAEANDDSVVKAIERVEIKVRDIVRENQVIF